VTRLKVWHWIAVALAILVIVALLFMVAGTHLNFGHGFRY